MTFRRRVALFVIVSTVVTLGAAFAGVATAFNYLQRLQLEAAILEVARSEVEQVVRGDLRFSDRPGPVANAVGPFPKYGVIYDRSGAIVDVTEALRIETPPGSVLRRRSGEFFELTAAGSRLWAVLLDVPGGSYRVLLAAPREDIDDDARFLIRAMVVAGLAATAWSTLLALLLVGRLTRDHDRIAAAVRRVAGGDLGARVGPSISAGEVGQLARDVDGMIERIAVLLASQQRFIANAAHELRTPLTSLHVELQLARKTAASVDVYAAAVDEALDATRRLRRLLDDLLSLARAGSEHAHRQEVVDWRQIAAEAVEQLGAHPTSKELRIRLDAEEAPLRGCHPDLVRLARNLLENAVRHAPPRSEVVVSARLEGGRAILVIDDEGPGIPVEERVRIFEPFFRASGADRDHQGSGLGLAIVRDIARAHAGDVLATDNDRGGARFVVSLPALEHPLRSSLESSNVGRP